ERLAALGWDAPFARQLEGDDDALLARVVETQRGAWRVAGAWDGWAELSGRLRHETETQAAWPVVGDWVTLAAAAEAGRATISRVLPRRSQLSRAAAGTATAEQVVAANVDTAFLVTSCNQDLSPHRLDRYLTMVWEGGAVPVVLLNKMDLCDD